MELTNLELAILGLIAEAPKHGYQIERDIQLRGMREWAEIGFSSIYHVLNKLERENWLEAMLDSTGKGPARKVYFLSSTGRAGYRQAVLTRLASPRRNSGDLELALANLSALTTTEIISCLENYAAILQSKLEALDQKRTSDRRGGLPIHVEWLFDHSVHALESELAWIKKLLNTYKMEP